MAYSKTIIVGRLVADPEQRSTNNGVAVANVRVAVDRPNRKGADRETDFYEVVAWRKSAEFLCNYFHKGDEILVEGAMQSRKYDAKDGTPRTVWELVASEFRFVGGRKSDADAFRDAKAAFPATAPVSADDEFRELEGTEDLPF